MPHRPSKGASCNNTLVRETALSLVVRTMVACAKPEMPGPGPGQRSPAAPAPADPAYPARLPPASSGNAHTRANLHDREGFITPYSSKSFAIMENIQIPDTGPRRQHLQHITTETDP